MTKKIANSGRITLYSRDDEFITSRDYRSINDRKKIIDAWTKRYPHQLFYIVIKPQLNED
jgi:hypothetical protein